MLTKQESFARFVSRFSAVLVLFLMLNVCSPLIASAASIFSFQFLPASGEVYGYIYSDKPTLSVSVNDETYGTRSVVQNLRPTSQDWQGLFYYNLDGITNNGLKNLMPVTATVYENSIPLYSTLNNVIGNVYTYEKSTVPSPPTGLHATISHGQWLVSWDSENSPFQKSIRAYWGTSGNYGESWIRSSQKELSLSYVFGAGPIEYQFSSIDVMGNESAKSEKVTLETAAHPDGYHYQGNLHFKGMTSDGTKIIVKDKENNIIQSLVFHDKTISGQSQLGRYSIEGYRWGNSDFPGYDSLVYQFDLPNTDYTIEIINSEGDSYVPKTDVWNSAAYLDYEGKFATVNLETISMASNFQTNPTLQFSNKESGHWLEPKEDIVVFTPTKRSKVISVYFPYDSWPIYGIGEHNTTTVQADKLSISDFQLEKKSNGSYLGISKWSESTARKGLVSFELEYPLEANQQYVLRMSPTSGKNEIRLPVWSGSKFSAGVATSNVALTYFESYESIVHQLYEEVRTVNLKAPSVPNTIPTPVIMGGGGGGFISSDHESTNNGVKMKENASTVKKESGADGKEISRVLLKADSFSKAIDALKATDKDSKTLTLEIKDAANGAKIDIPASSMKEAIADKSKIILNIQSDVGNYNVPVSIFKDLASKLNKDLNDVTITISVTKASEKSYEALQQANPSIKTLLANPIEFTITAQTASGSKSEVNDFNGTYVERKIIVPNTLDTNTTTVVSYDPETGKMVFIPATITQVNGKSEITFKSSHNSIYTVVELKKSFDDVKEHWAKSDIELLASKFVVQGTGESTFGPEQQVTRAQFASMLVSALGLSPDASSAKFKDVNATDWFAGAVGTAAKVGLVEGTEGGLFEADKDISREQMAIMIARAIKLAGKETKSINEEDKLARFGDGSAISEWAKKAVAQTIDANIVNGLTEQTFAPQANATRAQATVMMKRFLQYVQFIN
ncbi:hypothetical protein GCM10008018_56780 [Paenibacillus marchantiophytorum]|uniref:SLH domain-containing protein n=1 Tax=Paenibacillus marchantiophytorum TaxID=1619310 RepID=A0ABQ1FA54_9BACL|nr:S-layer homology domain-containing protein [Paenibacillus marchantiophytorum]GGA03432.1 hypothetical protein GCM10008018_56780 [Paenibacillus marchantiophytorum]